MRAGTLVEALGNARVLVCAGTGGVGKTTISAALAIEAARAGRRTLVLTIDPARRLADALGVEVLGAKPVAVDLSPLASNDSEADARKPGSASAPAQLTAMMLDPKPTFDGLVSRFAPDDAARDRILGNRIYRHLSEALAGSAEYAAMVQVHELLEANEYDLIVVDTPPADHALDFLRAPKRMREFLESRFVRAMVHPAVSAGRFGARLFGRGLARMLSLIERIAGGGFLDDVSEFLLAVDSLSVGFNERSEQVENVLLGDSTRFVLVCGGNARANASALDFLAELETFHVPLVAVVANRLRPWLLETAPEAELFDANRPEVVRQAAELSEILGDPEAGEEILTSLSEYAAVCLAQRHALAPVERATAKRRIECLQVEEVAGEIDHLAGLAKIGANLGRPRARGGARRAEEPGVAKATATDASGRA